MGRLPEACRDKWRQATRFRQRSGLWAPQEREALLEAMSQQAAAVEEQVSPDLRSVSAWAWACKPFKRQALQGA